MGGMIRSGTHSCNVKCEFGHLIEVVIGAAHLRVMSVKVYIIFGIAITYCFVDDLNNADHM